MILGIEKNIDEIKQDILTLTGLHESKLRNIYVFGSRVYDTYTINSDVDFVVIACSMHLNREFHEGIYNVHVTTPDSFKEQLGNHDIHCLECIYAPKDAKIMENINYLKDFKLNYGQLKKMLISQSAVAWSKARKRIEQGNIIGGAKSLFHCLRILKFGLQISKYGKIVSFKESNYLWSEIKNFQGLEWQEYQDKWVDTKKSLMKQFRNAGKTPFENNQK
jgi:predicted nucleotidyltransferase